MGMTGGTQNGVVGPIGQIGPIGHPATCRRTYTQVPAATLNKEAPDECRGLSCLGGRPRRQAKVGGNASATFLSRSA